MSNYLSSEYRITNPPQYGDLAILDNVMTTLQGNYNTNKAIIDQTLASYSTNLRGLRDSDNEYMASKLAQVKTTINQHSLKNPNLAYNSNKDSILSAITNVLQDPIVQDALISKQNFNALTTEYQKIKEKNLEKANEANLNYALYKGGYQEYMQGKTNKLGSMQYTPYTEYRKELKDIAENIEKFDTDIKKTQVGGDGYIYTKEGKVITPDKVRALAESFLTAGAKQQLVIDGWATIHQGNTEEERLNNTKTAFNQYKTQKLDAERETLLYYQAQAKKTGAEDDENNAKIAQDNFNNLEKRLSEIETNGTAEQMYGTVYKDSVLDSFSKNFSYNTVDITNIKGDSTYMAKVRMEFDREMKELEARNKVGDSAFQTKSGFDETVQEPFNVQQQAFEEIEGLNSIISNKVNLLFESLDDDTREGIDLEVKNSKGMKTREDVLIEYQKGGLISNADAEELNKLVLNRYVLQTEYNQYKKEAEKSAEEVLESPEMLKSLVDNPNAKIMWKGEDGKERLMSAKDVLINSGVVNERGEKIKNDRAVKEALKKSILAYNYLSTKSTSYLRKLAESMGEDYNKVFVKTGVAPTSMQGSPLSMGTTGASIDTFNINPNSKTGKFIIEQQKQGGFERGGFTRPSGDSFYGIPKAREFFQKSDVKAVGLEIGKKLMKNKNTSFGLITTVMPGTVEYAQIAQQVGFNIKSNLPLEIKKVPNQPNLVTVTEGKGSASKISPTEVKNAETIRIEDLHPNVLNQVDFYNTKSVLRVENFPDMREKTKFTNKKGTDLTAFAGTFYGGRDTQSVFRASLTTQEGATNFYFKTFADLLGTEVNPTQLGMAVKNIISSEETYVETQKTKTNDGTFILPIITKNDETIYTPPPTSEYLVNEQNADSVQKAIKFTPQDYINNYLMGVLQSQDQNQVDKLIKLYGQQ